MSKQKIKQLRQRVHDLKAEGKDKLGKLKDTETKIATLEAKSERSEDETRTLQALKTEAGALNERIDVVASEIEATENDLAKEERAAERERLFGTAAAPERTAERPRATPGLQIRSSEPDPNRFATFGEQLQAVFNATRNPGAADRRLFGAATGLQEAVGADGGFLVQQEFSTELLEAAHEAGLLASRVRRIPAGPMANSIALPTIDETSRVDGSRWGGVVAYWDGEAEQYTAKKPKFSKIELKLGKLTGLCYATDEMLQDVSALGSFIGQAFTEEFGFKLDDSIFRGSGVGMPLGFINSACKVEVAKEGSQTAATINEKNVLKMWARMPARLRPRATWLINQDAEVQLPQMVIGNQPVYLPPTGLSGSGYGTLMGRPVLPIEQCETVGTAGDIVLAALDQYIMYEKGGMETATSIHVRFEYGEQAFRFTLRADGKPAWKAALTPFKGTNTLSPFITLQTRS